MVKLDSRRVCVCVCVFPEQQMVGSSGRFCCYPSSTPFLTETYLFIILSAFFETLSLPVIHSPFSFLECLSLSYKLDETDKELNKAGPSEPACHSKVSCTVHGFFLTIILSGPCGDRFDSRLTLQCPTRYIHEDTSLGT